MYNQDDPPFISGTIVAIFLRCFLLLGPLLAAGCLSDKDHSPRVDEVYPEFGSLEGGETVTIRGDQFKGDLHITFGSATVLEVMHVNDEEIRVTTPQGLEGPVDVIVLNADGLAGMRAQAYTYQDPVLSPQILSVLPTHGLHEGGTPVTLSGSNFQPGAQVTFGGVESTQVSIIGQNLISAVTPSMPVGDLEVRVVNGDGRKAILLSAFHSDLFLPDEESLLTLVNQARADAGLGPLIPNPLLNQLARNHSQDMILRNFFGHVNPDGKGPDDRALDAGYSFQALGENIAASNPTPFETMQSLMNSPEHRANILNPVYEEIGIGKKIGGAWGVYWTQEFGKP